MSLVSLPKKLVGVTFSKLIEFRNLLFDQGILKATQVPVPVVSVGNLSVGGTGKTPMLENLIAFCLQNGILL